MGDLGKHAPNFGDLGKPTVTVDVLRLQAELRALHQRIEFLELAAAVEAEERAREDHDRSSGSSGPGVAGGGSRAAQADDVSLTDSLTVEPQGEPPPSPLFRSATTGSRKKNGAVNAALQSELRELSETVEALAASSKRREKAAALTEKATGLSRSMEIKRIQAMSEPCILILAIESRVTSDDLQLAVNATDNKLVAMQSSVDSALSDRFRRMQNVVHEQASKTAMASLLSMVQALIQQQGKSSHGRGSHVPRGGSMSGGGANGGGDDEGSSDDDADREAFDKAVTNIVHRVLREENKKERGAGDVKMVAFESLQEDYETFKGYMEEKADRQDAISFALEEAQARLEHTDASLSALTEEVEHSSQDIRGAMDTASDRQSDLDTRVRAVASLAADANGECAVIRSLVVESRRETQAEARQDAETIAGRVEGRVKAEVNKARGDARTATEKLSLELKRHIKRAEDEAEGYQGAIAGTRALSEKAVAGAAAAAAKAEEGGVLLQRAETRMGQRLGEAVQNQTAVAEDTLERIAAGESELARAESELKRLLDNNGAEIEVLRTGQKQLRESAEQATDDLKGEVQHALSTMIIMDQVRAPAFAGGSGGGRGRGGTRGGGVSFKHHTGGNNTNTTAITNSNNNCSSISSSSNLDLPSLGLAIRRQNQDAAHQVLTLQRSGVGIVTVLRKMEAAVQTLSTKDLFWKAVDTKLTAHQRAVGDVCLQVEDATVAKRSRITLSKEAQACLAGDMQRVAKLMAVKADYEVIRELAKLEGPEQTGQDWDERVEFLRQTQMRRFMNDCRDALDKTAPEARTNFNGEEIRGKFLGKLSDALRVALSKYSPTTPGATLFGKIKLKAKACLACDRPFTPSATGRPGPTPPGGISGAAVEPDGLPEENSHITKDTFRPHTSHGRLDSPSRSASLELFEPQHTSIHSVMSGGRGSPESPHVYRGGFKLPKHLKSPLHLPDGEDGSAFGIGHASPLLHKCPSMTGLSCYNDVHTKGRPSTSGGMRRKGRPPSKNTPSPPATAVGGRTMGMGQDGGGSVISAFTVRTDYAKGSVGGGDGMDGMLTGFGDNGGGWDGGEYGRDILHTAGRRDSGEDPAADGPGPLPRPYYATSNTLSRPSTPHDGSVRLLT
ncbi:unnamed protein product [Pylaiella littoralis]